jgi:alpha-1,3-rhamnosyltransferase
MPAYNYEQYVQESIESIINQTYKNLELIIIDDGSTDNTWEKINQLKKKCEKRFARVVFMRQSNQGTSITLQKLINMSSGVYISSVSSDDRFYCNAIAVEHDFLALHPEYVFVVGNNDIVNSNSERIGWDVYRNPVELSDENCRYKTFCDWLMQIRPDVNFFSDDFGTYDSLEKGNYIPNGWMIRSAIAKDVDLSEKTPMEDWYLNLYLSQRGKFHYIDQILYSYRWHGKNTILKQETCEMLSKKTLRYAKRKKMIEKILRFFRNH